MAHLVGKVLAMQTRGTEFNLQNLHLKSQVEWSTFMMPALGRWRQAIPGSCWSSSLAFESPADESLKKGGGKHTHEHK